MAQDVPRAYRRLQRERRRGSAAPALNSSNRGSSELLFADAFTIQLSDEWSNETVYVLEGPMKGGERQTVRISVDQGTGSIPVVEYADVQIRRQQWARSKGQVVFRTLTSLDNGIPAYWMVSQWKPPGGEVRLQHLCFVVHENTGYRLATSFSKTIRAVVEPRLIRMIRSFEPHSPIRERF